MYYLNGLDNSMILISTLPLKDLSSGFKESTIGSVVDSRRAEMLLQANALDERELLCPAPPFLAEWPLFHPAHHL
jgi:two-component system sensor histidine kinase RcsD